MRGVKILFIIRQAEFGGGETHIKYIFDSIDRELFNPVLVSLKEGYLSDYAKSLGINFYLLSNESHDLLRNILRLFEIIKMERIKFIHAHGTKGAALVLIPAILTRKKLIYTVHSFSFHRELNRLQYIFRKFVEWLICLYAYRVIFVSESDFKIGNFISLEKKVLIKNGVDVFRYFPSKNKKLREKIGYNQNDFVIGYFSRFTPQKNPFFVIELIKSLESEKFKSNKNFKLLMIGDGELKEKIIEKVTEYQLNEVVKILEPSYEIENYLNIIDCYILPSLWEGLPYGILEAMACSVPVIASNIPNICEIIESEENGFCEEIDVYKFKEIIIQLSQDEKLYNQISSNARLTIEKKFNIEESIIELVKIYGKLKVHD